MKLFTLIFYMITFTQLSYTVFFDFCLISLFFTSAYSYELLLPENNKLENFNSDPIVAVFYITKYLLHFIYHYLCRQKHKIDENDLYNNGDMLNYLQYKGIKFIEWYNSADNYYTDVIINQSITFIQTTFICLLKYIATIIITILSSKNLPTVNIWQTNNNLKNNIEILDIELDADLELETDSDEETKKTK